jgi:ribosomal protein S18 acetylase RimI-like enzyme
MLIETWHATYDAWLGAEKVREITAAWHSPEQLAAQVDRPDSLFLLADAAGTLVGTGFANTVGEDGAVEIGRLYVLPHQQGRGIGSALLAALLAGFPAASRIHLDVEPRNAGAIRFYSRHGFAVVAASTDCCGGSGVAHLRMQLTR